MGSDLEISETDFVFYACETCASTVLITVRNMRCQYELHGNQSLDVTKSPDMATWILALPGDNLEWTDLCSEKRGCY
jgi:hypothetical protein